MHDNVLGGHLSHLNAWEFEISEMWVVGEFQWSYIPLKITYIFTHLPWPYFSTTKDNKLDILPRCRTIVSAVHFHKSMFSFEYLQVKWSSLAWCVIQVAAKACSALMRNTSKRLGLPVNDVIQVRETDSPGGNPLKSSLLCRSWAVAKR